MSRQAVFAHRGNVPDVGSDKLAVKRLSWMGAHKTESVIVTFEDSNRAAQAEEARKQREKIMGNIRMQLHRINEMLESPQRDQNQQQNGKNAENNNNSADRSPASAMSAARSRQADPKQLVSYLDGTTHSRFSIANYNAYVRAKMISVLEAHPPNASWPVLPTDDEFPVPAISEGTGVSPSNVTSAPTWRDMLGGRGTIGYNTKAASCSKELLQYEFFQGVDFGEGFNDKATAAGPLTTKEEEESPLAVVAAAVVAKEEPKQEEQVVVGAADGTARPAAAEEEKQQQQQQPEQKQEEVQPPQQEAVVVAVEEQPKQEAAVEEPKNQAPPAPAEDEEL